MIDSSRQVIRWSIPGWVLVLLLSFLRLIENIWMYGSIGAAMQYSIFSRLGPGAVALVVLSGVPIGFLLTQFYYAIYWNWLPLRVAKTDRGGQALKKISQPAYGMIIKYHPVKDTTSMYAPVPKTAYYLIRNILFGFDHRRVNSRRETREYRDARKINFEAVRFYLTLVSTHEGLSQFKEEYTNLSDIYHCIGASLTAVLFAASMFVLYHFVPLIPSETGAVRTVGWHWPFVLVASWTPFSDLLISIVIGVLVAVPIGRALQKTRKTTLDASQAILESAICWHADHTPSQTPALSSTCFL